jgi:cell division septation protein DedD
MQDIQKYVVELLFKHDCVIIPNLGGFVAQYKSAALDEVTGFFSPPSKQILFNINLKNNDGLLANEIAQRKHITYNEANELITSFVSNLNQQLNTKKSFTFLELGTLISEEKSLIFKQKSINFLTSSFGLAPINVNEFKPLIESSGGSNKIIDLSPKVLKNSKWWVAAAIVPLLFYTAWIPLKTDLFNNPSNFNYSDLNPFTYTKNSVNSINEETAVNSVNINNKLALTEKQTKEIKAPKTTVTIDLEAEAESTFIEETTIETSEEVLETPVSIQYHVIVGCFGNKKNAIRLVKKLNRKGYSAFELDLYKNLHRISLGTFYDKDDALTAQKKIKKEEKMSSWILTN